MAHINLDELSFGTPRSNQGQTIEVSYAYDGESELLVRRTRDTSDGAVTYDAAELDDDEFERLPLSFAACDSFDDRDLDWEAV